MNNYFYSDKTSGTIKEELLVKKAKDWAASFIKPAPPRESWQKNPKLNSAQLRRFYGEVKALEDRVRHKDKPKEEFPKIRPLVKMLKSKAAYACPTSGSDRKVPEEFRKYMEEMVDNVADWDDFKAFALCFEAVVGYFYGEGGR